MRNGRPHHSDAPKNAAGFIALALAQDAALVRMANGAGVFDLGLGEGLRALEQGGRLMRLGYARITDYAGECLGVSASAALGWIQLARELRERPILRRAVRTGFVSPRKALAVSRVAVGDDEAAWTAAAAALTERDLKKRTAGIGASTPEEFDVETLLLHMDPAEQDRLDAALAVARCVLGHDRPRWQLVESIAMEFLGAHGKWAPDVPISPEVAAVCDGDHDEWLALWSSRSEGVLRQLEALEVADGLVDGAEGELGSARSLDEHLRRLIAARRSVDEPLGRQAEVVRELRAYRLVGFSTFEEYCFERLGVAPRTVTQRIWLERQMVVMPEIREALRDGTLTYSKALQVARAATPGDVAEWIAHVAGTTCQQTTRDAQAAVDRQNRGAGVRKIWGPRDATGTIRLAIECARAVSAARGRPIDEGEALGMIGDHFIRAWGPEVVRLREKIGSDRLAVLFRSGGLCAVPGCSREAQHEHHVRYRSRGGGEETWNRIGICDAHHLAGVHCGLVRVAGRAGVRLVWLVGIEDGVPREVWVVDGDDDVRRVHQAG